MEYSKGSHTVYHHRYHIVWITKYRYKVLSKPLKERVREIVHQVAQEMHCFIENGIIASDHIHVFVSIPPYISVSDFVQKAKGRSSRKIQVEFQHILKDRYWGKHFWGGGYFSSTSGNVTDEMINEYINNHSDAHPQCNPSSIKLEP